MLRLIAVDSTSPETPVVESSNSASVTCASAEVGTALGKVIAPEKTGEHGGNKSVEKGALNASYNARLGVTIALVMLTCSVAIAAFTNIDLLRRYLNYIIAAWLAGGFVLYAAGAKRGCEQVTEDEILSFYRDAKYWGMVVLLSALLTYPIVRFYARVPAVQKIDTPKPTSPAPVQPSPPTFPDFKVTGIVLNGERSTAVINNISVRVGEMVSGATMKEIRKGAVTLEYNGVEKTFQSVR